MGQQHRAHLPVRGGSVTFRSFPSLSPHPQCMVLILIRPLVTACSRHGYGELSVVAQQLYKAPIEGGPGEIRGEDNWPSRSGIPFGNAVVCVFLCSVIDLVWTDGEP
jgi:hypothetical protein